MLRVLVSVLFVALRVASVHVPSSVVRRETRAAANVTETDRIHWWGSHGSACPTNKKPKLLFNHISKTGGTAVGVAFRRTVPAEHLKLEADAEKGENNAILTPQKKEDYFVVGLVRRPCDYLVSWYYQLYFFDDGTGRGTPAHTNVPDFETFVMTNVEKRVHLMTETLGLRYGSGENVHCMMRTHNLENDMIDCLNKFQACGGTVESFNGTTLADEVRAGMGEAVQWAHGAGRSVGDHPPCTELFNKDLEKAVLATEQTLIDSYQMETCCSSDAKQ